MLFHSTITLYWFVSSELNRHLFALLATLDEHIGLSISMCVCLCVCVRVWMAWCHHHLQFSCHAPSCYANQCSWQCVTTAHSKWKKRNETKRNNIEEKKNNTTRDHYCEWCKFCIFPSTIDWLLSIQMAYIVQQRDCWNINLVKNSNKNANQPFWKWNRLYSLILSHSFYSLFNKKINKNRVIKNSYPWMWV